MGLSRLLLLVCAACLCCTLAACDCQKRRTPPDTPKERLSLALWHTFNPEETRTLNRLLSRIKKTHPSWSIQATVIPFARAQNAFRRETQRCSAEAPDVLRAELPWIGEFVSRSLILPLPSGATPETAFLPSAQDASRYGGQRWILPASLDCLALLYNRSLVPSPPDTLDALLAQARHLTMDGQGRTAADPGFDPSRTARWGFFVRADAYWFLPFLWAFGGRLLDPDRAEIYIDSKPAVEALAWYRDLIRVHHVAPARPSPSDDYEEMMRRFGSGQVAMIVNGPWATTALLSQPAFRDRSSLLGVAPFPAGRSGKPAAPLSGHGWVVSRCSRRPRQAWELARLLSDAEAQALFARSNSLLPSLKEVYTRAEVRANRFVSGFLAALKRSRARPRHPAMARIFDDFNPAVQAVVLGDATASEALAGVARAWRRLLPSPASAPSVGQAPGSR